MSDERDEIKKIPIKNYKVVKVILKIILILVILVDIIWRFIYAIIGPYDYRRGERELHKIIPNAIEFFWNNENEFRRIALEITDNEVIRDLKISQKNFKVTDAYERRGGVYFFVELKDLSYLSIVYNPDFEYDLRLLVYCKKICDDWYIFIRNNPRA